ncbi:hypothetical protein MMC25_001305 [Agyrium rufum]|nr:hypothetical protein [Agyrium rufum]
MNPEKAIQQEFSIFTSIRSDGLLAQYKENVLPTDEFSQFYLLHLHRDRLLNAANAFQWTEVIDYLKGDVGLTRLHTYLKDQLYSKYGSSAYPEPLRIRIMISSSGQPSIVTEPAPPLALPLLTLFPPQMPSEPTFPSTWTIYVSPTPTSPTAFTTHKTTLRNPYDLARTLLPPSDPNASTSVTPLMMEILLFNPSGEFMEGSLTTPYFFREGSWITPKEGCGGNIGTTRRWALTQGLCIEGVVSKDSIQEGEVVWVSNGVRGFGWGKVVMGGLKTDGAGR